MIQPNPDAARRSDKELIGRGGKKGQRTIRPDKGTVVQCLRRLASGEAILSIGLIILPSRNGGPNAPDLREHVESLEKNNREHE